jgi:hypothetical protein
MRAIPTDRRRSSKHAKSEFEKHSLECPPASEHNSLMSKSKAAATPDPEHNQDPASLTRRPLTDPTSLLRYRDGLYAVDLLSCAVTEFDFFTWLADNPSDFDAICTHFGFAPRPADVLMTLLLSNQYLRRDAVGEFRLSRLGREHLDSRSPWSLVPYYASLKDRPVAQDFAKVLKTGKPANWSGHDNADADWHGAMENEEFANAFTAAMNCRGLFLGKALADTLTEDLSKRSRVLDIGGGSGIYACSLVKNHPHLLATVLEQAPVDAIARNTVESYQLSDQIGIHSGNMFHSEDWPRDCDVHLFSNVLHDWDFPEIEKLLSRSYEALPDGGLIAVHETFLHADKVGPLPVAEYSCILMHSTQGRCYSTEEIFDHLQAAGFSDPTHHDTAGDRGVITAHKTQR